MSRLPPLWGYIIFFIVVYLFIFSFLISVIIFLFLSFFNFRFCNSISQLLFFSFIYFFLFFWIIKSLYDEVVSTTSVNLDWNPWNNFNPCNPRICTLCVSVSPFIIAHTWSCTNFARVDSYFCLFDCAILMLCLIRCLIENYLADWPSCPRLKPT